LNIADGIVVLDPPRTGLGEGAIQALLSSRPSELVYISCNPLTQIQDYKRLSEIYLVKQSQGFDLFPHTYHMENVMHLIRR
jgi:23S rRNA (uracil1939-C5)-methyltransferase